MTSGIAGQKGVGWLPSRTGAKAETAGASIPLKVTMAAMKPMAMPK